MPTFEYEAMNARGETVSDSVQADSAEDAVSSIRAMNLFPTRVSEQKAERGAGRGGAAARPGRVRKKTLVIGGVSGKRLTTFTRQLATLTDAGIPVVQALNILFRQLKPSALRNIVGDVADSVEGGASLSEAMAEHPKAFDNLYCNMVKAGEAGGMLDTVLERLAEFREKAAALRRHVRSALYYPVFVIVAASLIVSGIVRYIIPIFMKMFDEMDVETPRPTELLLGFTEWFLEWWWTIPLMLIGLFVLYKLIRATRTGRHAIDWFKFNIPIMGPIFNKSSVARFTRTFGTLISSGVPILEALNISRDTAGNAVLASAIQNVHDAVREGDPIAAPLSQSSVCDEMVVNMIDVGEETGNLDDMLVRIADNYEEQVDVAVDSMTSLMEPVLVVFLGLIVAFIVISLFLPLVSIMTGMMG
jgi:type IV pilus assembly protein PilC